MYNIPFYKSQALATQSEALCDSGCTQHRVEKEQSRWVPTTGLVPLIYQWLISMVKPMLNINRLINNGLVHIWFYNRGRLYDYNIDINLINY